VNLAPFLPSLPERPHMDQEGLRLLIQRKLRDGRLPHDRVTQVWGSPSDGETCAACDTVLTMAELVMEGTTHGRNLQFHVRCFQLWDDERRN